MTHRFARTDQEPKRIGELETPGALVDLDRLSQNLDRMAAYCALHGLDLRPHVKTHKSPRIAAQQLRLGATGLTCATPRELEVMSEVSRNLLIAHPLLGAAKLLRVLSVAREVQLTVALDSMIAIDELAATARVVNREVGVFIEVDLGMHRVGAQTIEDALALALYVRESEPLHFAGLAFYPGHIREPVGEQSDSLAKLRGDIAALLDRFHAAGVSPRVVSGGSTPAAWRMHEITGVTEVRPGTYVYNDRTTAALGACGWDDCAFTVLATVVSTSVSGQAVIDAGSKALGREPMRGAAGEGFGVLSDHPDVVVARMSEEHGMLDLTQTAWRPRVGDQVRVIPNHVCVVVHLNDVIHGVRGDQVETWWPVSARGREASGGGSGQREPGLPS
jgi:D-serine deaminase-like pyridoxal phosphate-dependent protein